MPSRGGRARRSVRNFALGKQAQGHTETRFLCISDTRGIVAKARHINVPFSHEEDDYKSVPNPEICIKRYLSLAPINAGVCVS